MTELAPDPSVIQEWMDWWFHSCLRGQIQIGWRDADTGELNRFRNFELGDDEIGAFVADTNAIEGQSVYFRAATVAEGTGIGGAKDADFIQAPGIWGDIDDEGGYARASTVEPMIRPNAWVQTGAHPYWRAQPFWRLESPCTDAETVRALNRRVVALYQSDPVVINPTRLMRVPGTIAWPIKPGRIPELTRLILPENRAAAYSVEALAARLPAERMEEPQQQQPAGDLPKGPARVSHLLRQCGEARQWHDSVLRLVAHWVGRGWSDEEIQAVAPAITMPGFTVQDTRRDLARMIEGARRKWGVASEDRPVHGQEPASPFAAEVFDPWDALAPLAFPIEALPPVLRDFAESRAAAVGCDPAAVAWAALSACSAALHGETRLQMKEHDKWSVPPFIWVALLGPSSARKSPAIRAAWSPLEARQAEGLRRWRAQMQEWENLPKKEKEQHPPPPKPIRFVSHDATMESVQGILADQDRGLGILKDELAGFIGSLEKYSSGRGGAADRAFYLQAFDGGPYIVDRVGRGTMPVNNLLVAICGGIQPDRLASFGDLTDDGLWQRFVPVIMAPPRMGADMPAGDAEAAYGEAVARLMGAGAFYARLTPPAQEVRKDVERRLFELECSDALGGRFSSFIGKLYGIWGRLALVLHALDPDGFEYREVSATAARRAAALIFNSVIPSAARVYAAMGGGAGKAEPVKDIAGFILAKRLERLVASDLTRKVRCCRGMSLVDVQRLLSPLVAGGWLTPEKDHGGNNAWAVNPAVHNLFADRAAREQERRERVRELLLESTGEVGSHD